MDRELEAYFDNYNQLFNHDGFKQLVEELQQNAKQLTDIQTVKDSEELFYRKGQVAALATVINLESTVTAMREQVEAEEQGNLDV
jgi:isocitrate lyase